MIEYLNPGDERYPDFGLNPGAATDTYAFAGGMAMDPATMRLRDGITTIADETRAALADVAAILAEAGCTLADVVKTTCYLTDDSYRQEFWQTYKEVFGDGPYPARCTFVVGLAGGCHIEIDTVALRPGRPA